jgi:hypothetical protein
MQISSSRLLRWGARLALPLASLLAGGCSTFNHEWTKVGQQAAPANSLLGRWQGTWKSDVNGHTDRLQCLVTPGEDGRYRARFHANYRKVMNFGYTVQLQVAQADGTFQFSGHANLGWWAGGVYDYQGHADGTNFFATYRCKYDHGTFQMGRPQ